MRLGVLSDWCFWVVLRMLSNQLHRHSVLAGVGVGKKPEVTKPKHATRP